MKDANYWIEKLEMSVHPEGTYFKENYRSSANTSDRSLLTSVSILMKGNSINQFHYLDGDEIWYFHEGDAIDVYLIHLDGKLQHIRFGKNIEKGEQLQIAIPSGTIFGAIADEDVNYCLFGCAVAPGFEFSAFHISGRADLLRRYPEYEELITKLTK